MYCNHNKVTVRLPTKSNPSYSKFCATEISLLELRKASFGMQSPCGTMSEDESLLTELKKAAREIASADVLLIATGAGFSADSGLPVYADIARHEKYASLGVDYADLADMSLLIRDPELFLEFWHDCAKMYKETPPHEGYSILDDWCKKLVHKSKCQDGLLPYCVYTSNVDGHFRRYVHLQRNLFEMHGCALEYICSSSIGLIYDENKCTDPRSLSCQDTQQDYCSRQATIWSNWQDKTTSSQRLECRQKIWNFESIEKQKEDFDRHTHASCSRCSLPLRPKVIMFGDTCPNVLSRVMNDTHRYQQWENGMESSLKNGKDLKLVIIEMGCGTRVPSIRQETEEVLRDVAKIAKDGGKSCPTLIRINSSKDDAFLGAEVELLSPTSVSIWGECLASLRKIHSFIGLTSFSAFS